MPDIYEQHNKSFSNVAAYVIAKDGKRMATIAIIGPAVKSPKDSAGPLHVYVHWIGEEMVRGSAIGKGYDRLNAAIADAARKLQAKYQQPGFHDLGQIPFMNELRKCQDGSDVWNYRLQAIGFDVWQAV